MIRTLIVMVSLAVVWAVCVPASAAGTTYHALGAGPDKVQCNQSGAPVVQRCVIVIYGLPPGAFGPNPMPGYDPARCSVYVPAGIISVSNVGTDVVWIVESSSSDPDYAYRFRRKQKPATPGKPVEYEPDIEIQPAPQTSGSHFSTPDLDKGHFGSTTNRRAFKWTLEAPGADKGKPSNYAIYLQGKTPTSGYKDCNVVDPTIVNEG